MSGIQRALQTGDAAQDQRERARRRDVEGALQSPLLGAQELQVDGSKDIDLVTGQDNLIAHRLGKEVTGWLVTNVTVSVAIWRVESSDESKYLSLRCGTNCTVRLAAWLWPKSFWWTSP